jgi:hypothetical protein
MTAERDTLQRKLGAAERGEAAARNILDLVRKECDERDALLNVVPAVARLREERDTLAAHVKEMNDTIKRVVAERDALEERVTELLKTHGTTAREECMSAALAKYGFHDDAESTIVSRIRQMGNALCEVRGERDTLAARVKELEGRRRGQSLIFDSPNMSRARRVYVVFEYRDGSDTKVLIKDNNALGNRSIDFDAPVSSTAVNPAKPGLQPMKCQCGGKIEFGRERVGHCMTGGASCRVMDPPAPSQPPDGHMVHIPAEYCGKSSLMHAYADGYLAGKGAK